MTSESVYEVLTINAELILKKDPQALVYTARYTLYPETSGEVLAVHQISTVCVEGEVGGPDVGGPDAGGPVVEIPPQPISSAPDSKLRVGKLSFISRLTSKTNRRQGRISVWRDNGLSPSVGDFGVRENQSQLAPLLSPKSRFTVCPIDPQVRKLSLERSHLKTGKTDSETPVPTRQPTFIKSFRHQLAKNRHFTNYFARSCPPS